MTSTTEESKSRNGITQLMTLNEKFVGVSKQIGNLYLNGLEKSVESVTSAQQKLAARSKNETVESLVGTQVQMTRQMTSTFTTAARELLA